MLKYLFSLLTILLLENGNAQMIIKDNNISFQEPTLSIIEQTIDENTGDVYYVGVFKGALVINQEIKAIGKGGYDIFISKTDANGNLIWFKTYGSQYDDAQPEIIPGKKLIFKAGALYWVLKFFSPNGVFDSVTNNTPEMMDLFIKINTSNGNTEWIHTIRNIQIQNLIEGGDKIYMNGLTQMNVMNFIYDSINITVDSKWFDFNKRGNHVLKLDLKGDFQWNKAIFVNGEINTFSIRDIQYDKNNNFNIIAQVRGRALNIGNSNTILSGDGSKNQIIVIKTDSAFQNILIKNICFQDNIGNPQLSTSIISENAFYLVMYATASNNLNIDGESITIDKSHLLINIGKDLRLKQWKKITENNFLNTLNTVSISRIISKGEKLIFSCNYRGLNNSDLYISNQDFKQKTVLLNFSPIIDLNGPNLNYLVETDTDLNNATGLLLGDDRNTGGRTIVPSFYSYYNNRLYISAANDTKWNPWIIEDGKKIIKGSFISQFDKPEESNYVEYFNDGTRLVVGRATGYTALDSRTNTIQVPNTNHAELFMMRISTNNEVIWYKRSYSSLVGLGVDHVKMIDNKMHIYSTSLSSESRLGYTFKLDNREFSKDTSNSALRLYAKIGIDGIEEMKTLDVASTSGYRKVLNETTLLEVGSYINDTVSIGSKIFTRNKASQFIYTINPSSNSLTNGIKIEALEASVGMSIREVVYDDSDGSFIIITPLQANLSIKKKYRFWTDGKNYTDHDLSGYTINYPNTNLSQSTIVMIKVDFNSGIKWIKRIGGGVSGGKAIINNGNVYMYLTKTISGNVYFENTPIVENEIIGQNIADGIVISMTSDGKLNKYNYLKNQKSIISKVKVINGHLFLIGINKDSFIFGSLDIGFDGGSLDALALEFDENLNSLRSYRIASPYADRMNDCDIFNNSKITFAYSSQGNATLKQGSELMVQSLNKNVNNSISTAAFKNYNVSTTQFNSNGSTPTYSLSDINPADLEESGKVSEYTFCTKKYFYFDGDGDGFGDPTKSVFECYAPAGYVSNNSDCDDTEKTSAPCPCPVNTYKEIWATKSTNNPLTDAWFARKFPQNLLIGGTVNAAKKIIFTSATALKNFSRGNGKASQLSTTYTDPTAAQLKNGFATQLLYLRLNMALNPGFKVTIIAKGPYKGMVVNDFWKIANDKISSDITINQNEIGMIMDALNELNQCAENGNIGDYIICNNINNIPLLLSNSSANIQRNNFNIGVEQIAILPNPSNGYFQIKNNTAQKIQISIVDNLGRNIEQYADLPSGSSLRVGAKLKQGFYYIKSTNENGTIKSFKIIKN